MGGFLNALSFLAPIAPAQAEAREIRRIRGIENLRSQEEAARSQQQISESQQRMRREDEPVIFGKPEWDSIKGQYTQLALKQGKIVRLPIDGGQSPEEEVQRKVTNFKTTFKMATGHDPTDQQVEDATLGAYGIKAPANRSMTEYQSATLELRRTQQELKDAQFKASQDPKNPAYQIRLKTAENAALRGKAMWLQAQARALGSVDGQPLPGALLDAEGNPIGAEFAPNVRPSGTETGRADLATSAIDQMDSMKQILRNRPDIFGPGQGRLTNIQQWIGSQDPDAQAFTAAATTAADHLMGVFGGRSTWAGQRIEAAMGQLKTNPEAAIAALDQFSRAAKVIQQRGTRKTVGGVPQNAPPKSEEWIRDPVTHQLVRKGG